MNAKWISMRIYDCIVTVCKFEIEIYDSSSALNERHLIINKKKLRSFHGCLHKLSFHISVCNHHFFCIIFFRGNVHMEIVYWCCKKNSMASIATVSCFILSLILWCFSHIVYLTKTLTDFCYIKQNFNCLIFLLKITCRINFMTWNFN